MITEAYIKGRYDFGIGKLAVLIVEPDLETGELRIIDQKSWATKASFHCYGLLVAPNQFDMEITAAIWAVKWCKEHERKSLNIYANTSSVTKWYQRRDFPDTRPLGQAYVKLADGLDICADYAPKADDNMFNKLVNELAEKAKVQ